ncbi:MAG: PSD1 and planctomycete cytochrome C domain-containing protein [Gemmataceae bacterium]|nr:PSD1 and planctomycete cytochrome C domain-containing protein [Gemmataceae bacterium]
MRRRASFPFLLALLVTLPLSGLIPRAVQAGAPKSPPVEFNRDIRPILSNTCFVCHGPDTKLRKGELRLDLEADAFADRGGYQVLVPGKPADSELYQRITAKDARERMPPAKHGKQLTARQIDLLRRWIEQGAKWQGHWAFLPPRRAPLPAVRERSWPLNPIDHFVLARLDQEGLRPAPEADRRTLLRRLSFDLTGLPPTAQEVDAFLAESSAKPQAAWTNAVERLLTSPHHGERLAQYWLDVVRYADTGGYHSDNHRDVAPYRDYVIRAFNTNKRFDQFTLEQLGGDLLPSAAIEQKIASGYNRLLQTTEEGGAQPKEYTAKYAADRVRNTATAWLGVTLGCAECHNHKYDPFTTKDFYSFAAFFADINERAVGRQEQTLMPTPEQAARLKTLDNRLAALQKVLAAETPELQAAQAKWEASAKGVKGLPVPVAAALAVEPSKRNAKQKQILTTHFRSIAPELAETRKQHAEAKQARDQLAKQIPSTLVSMAGPPRTVRILPRGNWLDDSGEVVQPAVPALLSASRGRQPPEEAKDRRATRLDLGKWMVAPDNPLTARVFVNRLWKLMFGEGIVRTLDDFGAQGAWPSHPDLLDWLAVEFRDSGWDVRHVLRLMATSRTYRQSSRASEALKQRDPYNHLLARQGRFRLDAEMVRDNALAVSGLLSRKIGGPSAKPYQPAGYWKYLNFPTREWMKDKGDDLYRRGLYTYWCRTFLHPSLLAFDAPTREECTVERTRSNTPQQALVLLNDPTYVEAARVLAERVLREGGKDTGQRIHFVYRQALGRKAEPAEVEVLRKLYERHLRDYSVEREDAAALLRVGDRPAAKDLPAPEVAAWASVARVVLNLHETITRN